MIFCLSKVTNPSWDKRFWTLTSLREELEYNVCCKCHKNAFDIARISCANSSERLKILELLWTPCGLEFLVDNLTEFLIDFKLEGR